MGGIPRSETPRKRQPDPASEEVLWEWWVVGATKLEGELRTRAEPVRGARKREARELPRPLVGRSYVAANLVPLGLPQRAHPRPKDRTYELGK